jgi:L-2-hydroxyglutarate oxidase LhgO
METVDVVVAGAGVVGLACARALALAGREVLVLEAADLIGSGVSSRSSEVIHAGIYYPRGSAKALHCVRGRHLLYAYLAERHLPYRRCGKLLVATSAEQVAGLDGVQAAARANGVDDLRRLEAAEACALEPALQCVAALLSPSTGIVDSHALMVALLADAEHHGAACVLRSPVERLVIEADRIVLEVGGAEPTTIAARAFVNSTGLAAPALARRSAGFPPAAVPVASYAKGNYFSLAGRAPFGRLIYPLPEKAGLGVHLTLDLGGQARFGPDVQWIDEPDYHVDPARGDRFYAEIRKYWPALADGALQPAYAGVRPKISGPAEPAADFRILGPSAHGIAGVVQLFGIESPGLTSSLSIAQTVAQELGSR